MNSSRSLATYGLIAALALICSPAFAQVSISIDVAPPPLVVDTQPACPDDGYLWTPGYWAYDQDAGAYYWVPGAWVQPPQVGLLWTPAYWGWNDGDYVFYPGYWGDTVGFYGGVNYGHGYWGNGYGGGRWNNGHFEYNTAANNVSRDRVHNTYTDRSVVHSSSSRVSYNGGKGGLKAQPSPEQRAAAGNHIPATAQQQSHFQSAAQQRSHVVKVNAHPGAPAGGAQAPADKQASSFTGGDANKPVAPSGDQIRPQDNPAVTGEKPASPEDRAPAATGDRTPMVEDHTPAPSDKPMTESHPAPGAGEKPVVHEGVAPGGHPGAPGGESHGSAGAKPSAPPAKSQGPSGGNGPGNNNNH